MTKNADNLNIIKNRKGRMLEFGRVFLMKEMMLDGLNEKDDQITPGLETWSYLVIENK